MGLLKHLGRRPCPQGPVVEALRKRRSGVDVLLRRPQHMQRPRAASAPSRQQRISSGMMLVTRLQCLAGLPRLIFGRDLGPPPRSGSAPFKQGSARGQEGLLRTAILAYPGSRLEGLLQTGCLVKDSRKAVTAARPVTAAGSLPSASSYRSLGRGECGMVCNSG